MIKRIIIHHTAGGYAPNMVDLKAYHFLVTNNGITYKGKYKPEDNEDCSDGKYAAHTLKGNTGSIGVAACCNYNLKEGKPWDCKYPLRQAQFEAICKLCAELCIKYNIRVDNIYTHYGFDKEHDIKQGKIDIIYLPFKPDIKRDDIQNYFRHKILWYLQILKNR